MWRGREKLCNVTHVIGAIKSQVTTRMVKNGSENVGRLVVCSPNQTAKCCLFPSKTFNLMLDIDI